MAVVTFKFDKEKDLWNIWNTINNPIKFEKDFSEGIPEKIKLAVKGKSFEESKSELEKINSSFYNSKILPELLVCLNNSWGKIEKEYFARLEKITKKKFNQKQITCFITTISKCPYSSKEGWFMVPAFSSIFNCLQIAEHELFHLHFHEHFFEDLKNKIGEEKAQDIKEALTILLNLEFRDLVFVEDKGYETHKELRRVISAYWKERKDFAYLLEKIISLDDFKR